MYRRIPAAGHGENVANRCPGVRAAVPRPTQGSAGLEHDLHLVPHLQRPEQRGVGLDAPLLCLTTAEALISPASSMTRPNVIGWSPRTSSRSPSTRIRCPPGSGFTRVERNRMSWRRSTSSSIVRWIFAMSVVAEGLHSAGTLDDAKRRGVGGQLHAHLLRVIPSHELRLPGGHADQEVVPRPRRGPAPLGSDRKRCVVGSEQVPAHRNRHETLSPRAPPA